MKLIVERSGGFAGIVRRGEKDLAALLPEQQAALQQLLEAGPAPNSAPTGADRFTFRIEVQDERGSRSLTLPETLTPAWLAAVATDCDRPLPNG
jgi:hypothetical protein